MFFLLQATFLLGGGFGIAPGTPRGLKLLHGTSIEDSVRSWNRPDLSVEDFFWIVCTIIDLVEDESRSLHKREGHKRLIEYFGLIEEQVEKKIEEQV